MPGPALDKLPTPLVRKLDDLDRQAREIDANLEQPEIAGDHRRVRELTMARAASRALVEAYRELRRALDAADELAEAALDPELAELAAAESASLHARAEALIADIRQRLVTADDRSVSSIILEVRAGTGGDEAGLWARDLLTMYQRYADRRGWEIELLSVSDDPGAGGLRAAVASLAGDSVYAELQFESGVHAVKRVPATETQGRIHTSTATVAVLPEPRDVQVRIDWAKDVTEHVTTAQGPGGQNVNKVSTAVHLVHNPTGIEVRMQETKSQQQNRERARRLLMARVFEFERAKAEAERSADRRAQIGTGERSEKVRVYRYQDNIVADQRLDQKFKKSDILDAADLAPLVTALLDRETTRRLEAITAAL